MDASEDQKHPKPLSEMTDEELLRGIAKEVSKPAVPGKESAAEYLQRKVEAERNTKTVEVSVVTSYRDGAIATRENIGRIVFQVDVKPMLVTNKGYDSTVLPTLLERIQSDLKLGAVCGQIPSETVEHFWELVDGDDELKPAR